MKTFTTTKSITLKIGDLVRFKLGRAPAGLLAGQIDKFTNEGVYITSVYLIGRENYWFIPNDEIAHSVTLASSIQVKQKSKHVKYNSVNQ